MKRCIQRPLLATLLLVAVIMAAGCSSEAAPPTAADFPVMDESMLKSVLAEKVGKPVIVVFWATWCPSCREEMPTLERLSLGRSDEVTVMAISMDDRVEDVIRYFDDGLPPMETYMAAPSLGSALRIRYIPHMMIFGANGKLALSKPGVFPEDMLNNMVDKLQ